VGWPIAAPLERCAELLSIDLATIREAAANVEPYLRADGTKIWSLMQLERQLRPEVYQAAARRLPRPPTDPSHRPRLADEAAPFSAAPARPGRRARELGRA
jgi:hypothetical protein